MKIDKHCEVCGTPLYLIFLTFYNFCVFFRGLILQQKIAKISSIIVKFENFENKVKFLYNVKRIVIFLIVNIQIKLYSFIYLLGRKNLYFDFLVSFIDEIYEQI